MYILRETHTYRIFSDQALLSGQCSSRGPNGGRRELWEATVIIHFDPANHSKISSVVITTYVHVGLIMDFDWET